MHLYCFYGHINYKEPVILSVVGKRKAVDGSTAEAGFKEVFTKQRNMKDDFDFSLKVLRYFLLYSS